MKITFFVPTLEPGQDGVADYTLALAAACQQLGHEAVAIGFHDSGAGGKTILETPIRSLRLPQAMPWHERLTAIQEFRGKSTERAAASLQIVPYAFHPKGFVMGWAKGLRAAIGGSKLEVMFHELWLGTSLRSPWKHRIVGPVQRHFITHLLQTLKPATIHTSNRPYAEILRRSGFAAEVLPLFGNIPIQPRDEGFAPAQQIPKRAASWLIGFFGVIHPEWAPEPLFSELAKTGRPIVFVQLGRAGAGDAVWRDLEKRYGHQFTFLRIGEQGSENISQWLQHLDFGIATSPLALIEKSGTVAAMREHGLPVIVTRREKLFACGGAEPDRTGLWFPGDDLPSAAKRRPAQGVTRVAQQFLESFAA